MYSPSVRQQPGISTAQAAAEASAEVLAEEQQGQAFPAMPVNASTSAVVEDDAADDDSSMIAAETPSAAAVTCHLFFRSILKDHVRGDR